MHARHVSVATIGLLLMGMSVPAMAQTPRPMAVSDSRAVGLGLTFLHERYGTGNGAEMDLQVADFRAASPLGVGLVVEGGFNRFDGFTETTVMGGVRFAFRRHAVIRPFGQFLAGVAHCNACKSSDPTFEPAFGVNLDLTRSGHVSFRGQVGYRVTPSEARTFKETHILVGIAVAPGRRQK